MKTAEPTTLPIEALSKVTGGARTKEQPYYAASNSDTANAAGLGQPDAYRW